MPFDPVETTARGDGDTAAPDRDGDQEILARAREFFIRAQDAESEMRQERRDDLLFVRRGGVHQWPEYARESRGKDRPMLTDNRLKQFRTAVINNLRQNTPATKVRPVDDNADKRTAIILAGLIRHVEQTTGGDIAKDKAAEFAVDTGLGYFALTTRYVDDDAWDQEIAFRTIEDPFRVYFDPDSVLPDGSDAKRCLIVTDIPKEDYEDEYGDDSGEWHEGDAGSAVRWDTDHTRRIGEFFEIQSEPAELVMLADGATLWADEVEKLAAQVQNLPPAIRRRTSQRKRCHWYKLSSTKILEATVLPTQFVPVFPVYGEEFWLEGKHYVEGIVRQAKDPQRFFNFWLSCAAEQIALQPKAPWLIPEGGDEADDGWTNANTVNHPYLVYRQYDDQGRALNIPQRQAAPPVPTGYMDQMSNALEGIKAAVGMSNPAIGAQESAGQSGKALRTLQAASMIGTSHFGDNLAKSVSHCGRVMIELIQAIYDTRRIQRILGEDGTPEHAIHDPSQPQAYAEQPNPQGGIDKIYNLTVGRYDVAVEVGPSYASRREEGFDVATQLVQAVPNLMGVCGDLVVRMSDSPYADQMADRIKATIPPNVLAATESDGGEAPDPRLQQAQQEIQHRDQLIQQLDQAIQGLSRDLDAAKNDQGLQQAKLQLEARKAALEEEKARFEMAIEAEKLRVEAMKDGSMPTPEQAMAWEKMEREFDLNMLDRLERYEQAAQPQEAPQHDEAAEEDRFARLEQAVQALMGMVKGIAQQPAPPEPQEPPAAEAAEPSQEPAPVEAAEPTEPPEPEEIPQ